MSNPNDYTVGWICAVRTEYVAAQAFLDEKHEGPEYVSPNDDNDYTLGKVGRHNVIIAVLPYGEYGKASAGVVARDMLHSFPNVRIGLMVGIGGGAPTTRHDIRLGDVVVSAPRNGNSGVFQYDFGKAIQHQSFQTTGFLNQPPTVLRRAMNGLEAQYESEGHQLEAAINSVLERKPRLRKKYKRPDPSNDRLYQPGVVHPPNDVTSCMKVCGDDPSKLIPRPERGEDDNGLEIHYGLIASADQLIKDAWFRDRLSAEKDVLCFEMEAAGLVNHFPCLVIRGICDYSDSHKNEEWRGYAAMAAAAYAKDLLCRIAPNRIEAEKRIGDIISNVQDGVSELLSTQHNQENEAILKWLTPIDYTSEQHDLKSTQQEGTGTWLLDSGRFQDWLNQTGQMLFCLGIPGAGKTILTSIVVDYLSNKSHTDSTGIAYIYINFRRQDQQKPERLLSSLLKQLLRGQTSMPESIKKLYEHYSNTQLPVGEITTELHSAIAKYARTYIIIDALDEYQVNIGGRRKFLTAISDLRKKTHANIFLTSRHIMEIKEQFEGIVPLEICARQDDVQRYLEGHMSELPGFVTRDISLQEEISTGIAQAVGGMFLLAKLYMKSLVGKRSPNAVTEVLKGLQAKSKSSGAKNTKELYFSAYEETMRRIEGQSGDQPAVAIEVLSWITCAQRPLTPAELRHAIAIKAGSSAFDEGDLSDISDIVSVCAGLVTLDEESKVIRLAHYTTQEYFEETQGKWFPGAETNITLTCVTYLSYDVFGAGCCETDNEFKERLRLNKFFEYAKQNWWQHARKVSSLSEELKQAFIDFLCSEAKVNASNQRLLVSTYGISLDYRQSAPRTTGLHLAAYFGIDTVVKLLLDIGKVDADLEDNNSQTPLSLAAENGHEAIVKLLLDIGKADPNSKDSFSQTPLSLATENGHEAIVKLLLDIGKAGPNSKDSFSRTLLSLAALNGHEAIVKLLLDIGKVDPDSKDKYSQTPLSLAAENGHEAIVKLLLDIEKVDPDSKDKYSQTPLLWAAKNRHEAIVKLLLDIGKADPNSKDNYSRTPLSWAIVNGDKAIVKLLLDIGNIDINSKDSSSRTPLLLATLYKHEAIVKLLLDIGKVDY